MIGETAAGEGYSDDADGTVGEECGVTAGGSEDGRQTDEEGPERGGGEETGGELEKATRNEEGDETTEGARDDDRSSGTPAWGRAGAGTAAGRASGTRGGTMRSVAYGALVAALTDCESAGAMAVVPSTADFCGRGGALGFASAKELP